MRKLILTALILSVSVVTMAQTKDYAAYYNNLPVTMPVVQTPTIPALRVSLTDFGAIGDGMTINTEAFARAVSALNKQGGGHLDVPAGIWLTGPISLKDNIDLHIERNAIILFSPDKRDHIKEKDDEKPERAKACITASKRKNVSITGQGVIDGNGQYWRPVKKSKVSDSEWKTFLKMGGTLSEDGKLWFPFNLKHYDNVTDDALKESNVRSHMIKINDCENVLVQGVTIMNSPRFHLVPNRCSNLIIDGVTILCPWNAQNGDAMDIGHCKDVLIVNNTISCGDDGICMKGGSGDSGLADGPCENINIQDNTVYHAHGGFVIGSDFSGGMKNIVVRNCRFQGTDTGLRFKSAPGRGGETAQIFIDHIYMTDIQKQAIVFETTYVDKKAGHKTQKTTTVQEYVPHFNDIHISDVYSVNSAVGIAAHGEKGMVEHVTVSNSKFFCGHQPTDIDAACDIRLDNVELKTYGN